MSNVVIQIKVTDTVTATRDMHISFKMGVTKPILVG